MSIQVSDPLALLPYQSGIIAPPLKEEAANGQSQLDAQQRFIVLGEPIPIIFCRRVNNIGGVFVSPGATEGRFANNASTNELTVNLELVLSEGDLPQLQLRDVFQRACRVGTWTQTYDQRAGLWTPGNFITAVANTTFWNCPYYCGTSGTYENITTLSYTNTHLNGDETWNKQVHCFVREGMQVERIIDSVTGSSNNVVDLALYLIRQSSRFPESLIDTSAMLAAAQFTNTNQLHYNGEFRDSTNLEDWLQQISFNFLLRISDKNGKKGFRPRLPVNADNTIKITTVSWVFGFTEEHILPDGFQIEYISLSERKPLCAQILWRQQPDNDIGIIRSTEVRFNGEALNGPFEQYDLSQFCTSENHAVKVGAYIVARRKYVTHILRLRVRPDAFNSTLILGDIVRVQLKRETNTGTVDRHNYLYEVERINKNVNGVVELDLIHFPIDSQGRSLIARQVAAAQGAGYVLATGRTDFSCDIAGRSTNETPLPDEGGDLPNPPAPGSFEYDLPDMGQESEPDGTIDNPADPITGGIEGSGGEGENLGDAKDGDVISITPSCPNAKVYWYRIPKNSSTWDPVEGRVIDYSQKQLISIEENVTGPGSLTLTSDDIDYIIYAEYRCQDPSTPDGYGTPIPSGFTNPVQFNTGQYSYARYIGYAVVRAGSTIINEYPTNSCWVYITPNDYLTVGGAGIYSSGERIDDNGIVRASGPSYYGAPPWRTNISAEQYAPGSGEYYVGTLGKNEAGSIYNNYLCTGFIVTLPAALFGATGNPNTYGSAVLTGHWEFSNDGITVLATWGGNN